MTDTRAATLGQAAVNTVVAVGGVCLTARWPVVCAAVMGALLVVTLRRWGAARDFGVAAAGLVAGVTLELVATASGLWVYRDTTAFDVPLWVVTLWPTFVLGLPRLGEALVPGESGLLAPPKRGVPRGAAVIVTELVLFAILGKTSQILLTGIILLLVAAAWFVAPSRRAAVVLTVSAGFGVACEALPVQLGLWTYPYAAHGMPPWLVPGYALFGLGVVHLGQGLSGWFGQPAATSEAGAADGAQRAASANETRADDTKKTA